METPSTITSEPEDKINKSISMINGQPRMCDPKPLPMRGPNGLSDIQMVMLFVLRYHYDTLVSENQSKDNHFLVSDLVYNQRKQQVNVLKKIAIGDL